MSFFSTRGRAYATASQAILAGIAPDGGLYVPAMFPRMELKDLAALVGMSYPQRATQILRQFLDDFRPAEIEEMTRKAYGERFDTPAVAPLHRIDGSTWALELFHGPTLAFKDMALQLLPYLMAASARKNSENREISILVATSGDTGKAALEGFRDVPGTSCTVFYPKDGVSDIQRLQMVTTGGENTRVIAVEGNFDDAQTGVKALFSDEGFREKMAEQGRVLSSANSINFGRLVPQIVYYFSAYADLVASGAIQQGESVNFAVPTGNFGDILAGFYAREMGLPVHKLICASNRNNVLTDFFRTGLYSTHRVFFKTISPSMDILVSSNLERLLYEAADRDGELIALWMRQLKENGSYAVDQQRLEWLSDIFFAGCADDKETRREIRDMFRQTGYLIDPHTAVAGAALGEYRRNTGDNRPAVIVSTASPYKFAADVLSALEEGEDSPSRDAFACARTLEARTGYPMPPQVLALREQPIRHTRVCAKDPAAMAEAVLEPSQSA